MDNSLNTLNSYIVFDLETTGLSTDTDAIIEISALKVENGDITAEFSTLVNPCMHIPFMASSVNGITDDMVKDSPKIEEALRDFIAFIGDSALVGQNIVRFDMKFIQRDLLKYFGRTLNNKLVDTLFLSKRYLPDLDSHSLGSLADYYDVSYEGAHRALADCKITLQVYQCLIKESENPLKSSSAIEVCPKCGNILKKRNGKYGEFWGCASYPDCKFTKDC